MLIPNQNYFDLMVSLLNLMFLVKELILYLVALFIVVDAIARKTQLMDVLESVFSEQWDKILDLATYMMMTENNVMQYLRIMVTIMHCLMRVILQTVQLEDCLII